MTIVSGIFLLSAGFCVLMLFVLSSLLRYQAAGVKEWIAANAVALVSFILYALGRQLPPLLAYEAANVTYALAGTLALAGFLRFFSRSVPVAAFATGLVVFLVAITLFHYTYDSFPLRTVTVSAYQVAILSAIAFTIVRSREQWNAHYPYLFTALTATLLAIGNAVRAAVHVAQSGQVTSLLQPSASGIFFMSAGAFVLPVLTFGAMMMVHDRMLAAAGNAARRDFLTGALTSGAFRELLEHEWSRCRGGRKKPTLLMLGIDRMKSINEAFGHAVGDQVLVDIALQADRAIRHGDCFARTGGAEFAILLRDTERDAALALALRLLASIQRSRSNPGQPACTVSIGLATLCGEESMPGMLKRARAARDEAKAAGGDRVVCADPGPGAVQAHIA